MTSWGLWLLFVPLAVSLSVFPAPSSALSAASTSAPYPPVKAKPHLKQSTLLREAGWPVSPSPSLWFNVWESIWLLPEQIFITNNCNLSDLRSCFLLSHQGQTAETTNSTANYINGAWTDPLHVSMGHHLRFLTKALSPLANENVRSPIMKLDQWGRLIQTLFSQIFSVPLIFFF